MTRAPLPSLFFEKERWGEDGHREGEFPSSGLDISLKTKVRECAGDGYGGCGDRLRGMEVVRLQESRQDMENPPQDV